MKAKHARQIRAGILEAKRRDSMPDTLYFLDGHRQFRWTEHASGLTWSAFIVAYDRLQHRRYLWK